MLKDAQERVINRKLTAATKGIYRPLTLSKSQPMTGSYPHNKIKMNSTSMNTVTPTVTQQTPHYPLFTPTIHLKSYHRIQYWWKLNSTKPMTGTTSNPSCPNLNTHGETSAPQVKWRQRYLHKINNTSNKQYLKGEQVTVNQ